MVNIDIHGIRSAEPSEYNRFSAVMIVSDVGSYATLFLPPGKARAVADAINAALQPDMAVIDEVVL